MQIDFSGYLGDARIEQRAASLLNDLWTANSCVIQRATPHRCAQKAYYRLLANDKVTQPALTNRLAHLCAAQVSGKNILCIQDTSEINLDNHRGRLNTAAGGLGRLDGAQSIGFKFHASLAVEQQQCHFLGIPDVLFWERPLDGPNKEQRNYSTQPLEDKESARWQQAAQRCKPVLAGANRVIFVQDREGDIFSQLVEVDDGKKFFLLVRSHHDRADIDGVRLGARLAKVRPLGCCLVQVPGKPGKGSRGRIAKVMVRVVRLTLAAPAHDRANRGRSVEVSVVEAVEHRAPKGCAPLRWVLLSTLPVVTFEQALQAVQWYRWRWSIERLYALVKGECYDVEGSELERAGAIRNLTLLVMELSLRVLQMQQVWKGQELGVAAGSFFSAAEQGSLAQIGRSLEGRTAKQRNPYQAGGLLWATWIVARLGGWKGYFSGHSPGSQTLLRGLDKFYERHAVYEQIRDVGTQ